MNDLVDLHSHILPGLDDGSPTIAESEKMLAWYLSQGITTIAATPHLESSATNGWQVTFDHALKTVQELASPLGIRVIAGAEMRLSPNVAEEDVCPIEGTDYVLVDFPSGTWPYYAEEMLFQLQILGYRPILAHPERYGWKSEGIKLARALVNRGVVLQVTIASFTGLFGRTTRQTAIELLDAGVVQLLATDAHDSRGRLVGAETSLSWIAKEYGDVVVANLLRENPSNVLRNSDVEPVDVSKSTRRKFGSFLFRR